MKKLMSLILAVIMVFALTSCWGESTTASVSSSPFIKIDNYDNLYYDPVEKTVYVMYSYFSGYQGYGFMSPYYANNGLPYKYDISEKKLVKTEWSDIYESIRDTIEVNGEGN